MTVLTWVRGLYGWIRGNIRGFIRNTRVTVSKARLSNTLPPPIYNLLQWIGRKFPEVLGMAKPYEQIFASIVFAIFLFLSVVGMALAAVMIIPFTIGVLRQFPTINDIWVTVVPRWDDYRGFVPDRL